MRPTRHVPEACPCREACDYDTDDGCCARCCSFDRDGVPDENGCFCRDCYPWLREWDALTDDDRASFTERARPIVDALRGDLEAVLRERDAARAMFDADEQQAVDRYRESEYLWCGARHPTMEVEGCTRPPNHAGDHIAVDDSPACCSEPYTGPPPIADDGAFAVWGRWPQQAGETPRLYRRDEWPPSQREGRYEHDWLDRAWADGYELVCFDFDHGNRQSYVWLRLRPEFRRGEQRDEAHRDLEAAASDDAKVRRAASNLLPVLPADLDGEAAEAANAVADALGATHYHWRP